LTYKQKRKNTLTAIALLAVIGIAAAFLISPLLTEAPQNMVWVDTDGDGVADTHIGFSMFQALRVIYPTGDSWKYPPARTSLSPMSIVDTDTNKAVSSLQAYIFFNFVSSKTVSKVVYSANLVLRAYNTSKIGYLELGNNQISQPVLNPANNTDVIVTSSTVDATDFQRMAFPWVSPISVHVESYYVISVSNVLATVSFTDGTSCVFGLTGVQATENQLWWKFAVDKAPYKISSVSTEWFWR
jgi:hypothetical protein